MSLMETDAPSPIGGQDLALSQIAAFRLPLAAIVPARKNRDTINEVKLQELATSIAKVGVLQPILVRPLPGSRVQETTEVLGRGDRRPEYEIVCGERRWLASERAGMVDIPALVRALTDQEALEAQLVENLQRDDLHPLEEAEGYERLCEATGITKEQLGEKIGKSRSYVYNRLGLLKLTQEARDAFRQGKLDASKAELLATVADPKLQVKALKEFIEVRYGDRTMSFRECKDWLQQNVMLKLQHAPFSIKDATLCPEAGACTGCPKRTHHDRDLFAAFDGPDMCMDAACFRAKEAAHVDKIRANAAEKGMEVIAGKDAKALKPATWSDIKGYTKVEAKLNTSDGEMTVRKAAKAAGVQPILFVDPHTQEPVQVVPTAELEQALKAKGLIKSTRSDEDAKEAAKHKADMQKRDLEEKVRDVYERRALREINDKLRAGGVSAFTAPILRIHLRDIVHDEDGYGSDTLDQLLLGMWDLPLATGPKEWENNQKNGEAVKAHIEAAPDGALGVMLLQVLLAQEINREGWQREQHGGTPYLEEIAREVNVDLQAIHKTVKAELKPAPKPTKAKRAQEPAADEPAPPGATSEAAPQGSDARGGKGRRGGAKKPAGGAAPKISAEEAKSGIAEAMQGMEGPGGEGEPAQGTLAAFMEAAAAAPYGIKAGKTVRVLDTVTNPQLKKWVGKTGEVLQAIGDSAFDVSFKQPKGGKVLSFDKSELEVVPSEPVR